MERMMMARMTEAEIEEYYPHFPSPVSKLLLWLFCCFLGSKMLLFPLFFDFELHLSSILNLPC